MIALGFIGPFFGFLNSTLGRVAIALAVAGGIYLYGHHIGSSAERVRCEAQKQASIEAARQIDAKAAADARSEMERQTRESLDRLGEMQKKVDDYAKVSRSCAVGDAGAQFLDGLSGEPVRGPAPVPPSRSRPRP
jgi:hypothetical protein